MESKGVRPDALLLQELRQDKGQAMGMRAQLHKRKWQAAISPSVATAAGGLSAGAAIITPSWMQAGELDSSDLDRRHPGRFKAVLWPGVLSQGLLMATVYCYTGSGVEMQAKNADLLELVARELAAVHLPFVVGGDWNMPPEALAATGMAPRLRACIVRTGATTYTSGETETEIDYFLISGGIKAAVESVRVLDGAPIAKHSPVLLQLTGKARADTVLTLARPPRWPTGLPCSCEGPPKAEPEPELVLAARPGEDEQDHIDRIYGDWAAEADAHIAGQYGLEASTLRSGQPRLIRRPVLPLGGAGPKVDPWVGCLRAAVQLGKVYVGHRRRASERQAQAAWIRAMRLRPSAGACSWTAYRAAIRKWPRDRSIEFIEQEVDTWAGRLRLEEERMVARRKRSWDDWVRQAFDENSGARVYRFMKGTETPAAWVLGPAELHCARGPGSAEERLETKAAPWRRLWTPELAPFRPEAMLPRCERKLPAPMPTVGQFRDLLRTYSWGTGVGADHWRPRTLALLSDSLVRRLIAIMELMFLGALIPSQMALLLVVLIPKASGGERPIGIFPTVLRLLDRWFRWSYGAQWLRGQPADPFYGQRGRTVEDAIWRQGLLTEWATASGKVALTMLFDIAKAYEHIRHDKLWSAAGRLRFSPTMLCWMLKTFRMVRRLQVDGGLSAAVVALQSVVPGSSFADLAMRMMVAGLIQAARRRWPRVSFAVVVDDIQATCYGHEVTIRSEAAQVAEFIAGGLGELQLPVATEKLQMVGNSDKLLKDVARRCRLLKKARRRSARNLGADYAAGRPARHTTRAARLVEVLRRARRLRRLGRFGAAGLRFARTALGPAGLFAAAMTGVLPSHLGMIRRAYHMAAVKKPAGRSATVDVEVLHPRADPAYLVLASPLAWLAKETVMGTSPTLMISDCVEQAVQDMTREEPPAARRTPKQALAKGPVGAAVAAALTVGWEHQSRHTWKLPSGRLLRLDQTDPYEVKRLAEEYTCRWLWRQAATRHEHLAHLDGPPALAAHRKLTETQGQLTRKQAGLLRAFLAGAFFRSDTCVCGAFMADPMRLWAHLAWQCDATREQRQHVGQHEGLGQDWASFEEKIGRYLHTRWVQTALLPDPWHEAEPAEDQGIIEWQCDETLSRLFSGDCFGDGCCMQPGPSEAARAGWAVVEAYQENGSGKPCLGRTAKGTLPGRTQTADGAEGFALLYWLRNLDPASVLTPRFFTDSQRVADSWNRIVDNTGPWTPHRSLWEQVELCRTDVRNDVQVIWMKGHTSMKAAASKGGTTWLRVFGNREAHSRAREAAHLHPSQQRVAAAAARTDLLASRLGRYYALLLERLLADGLMPAPSVIAQLFRVRRPPAVPAHVLAVDSTGQERCVRCMLPTGLAASRPCRAVGSLGHQLVQLADCTACRRCGAYAIHAVKLLGMACHGRVQDPERGAGWRLHRILAGRHPRTGVFMGQPRLLDPAGEVFSILLE